MRAIASLARAISAADIWAKSLLCSTSRSDTVRRESISISRSASFSLSLRPENSASWMREEPACGFCGAVCTCGSIIAMSWSR